MDRDMLTIPLTDDQQEQIRAATGRIIRNLNINLAAMGHLTEEDLQTVVGGVQKVRESTP